MKELTNAEMFLPLGLSAAGASVIRDQYPQGKKNARGNPIQFTAFLDSEFYLTEHIKGKPSDIKSKTRGKLDSTNQKKRTEDRCGAH